MESRINFVICLTAATLTSIAFYSAFFTENHESDNNDLSENVVELSESMPADTCRVVFGSVSGQSEPLINTITAVSGSYNSDIQSVRTVKDCRDIALHLAERHPNASFEVQPFKDGEWLAYGFAQGEWNGYRLDDAYG